MMDKARPCPGWGRHVNRCGVLTTRPLCFFCQKSKRIEESK